MDGKTSLRIWCASLAGATALGLGGCAGLDSWSFLGGGTPLPDEPGLYAVTDTPDGEPSLRRLDGPKKWEIETWHMRSDLDPGVSFMIRHPDLGLAGRPQVATIHLRRVAWVRSTINTRGEILPVEGSRWAVPDLDLFEVPVRLQRTERRDDVVHVVPAAPLEPGLYSLELATSAELTRARIGVQWTSVDQRSYSAATCVDQYAGAAPQFRPCAEQRPRTAASAAPAWLRLYLVDPQRSVGVGGQNLVIRGVVVNTSDARTTAVPPLQAEVRTADGSVIRSWRFDPGVGSLKPGQSASFRTEARAPAGAHDVHVRFASSP